MDSNLPEVVSEDVALSLLMYESTHIKSHLNLMLWLQGASFQKFIAHEIMIAAWGDFSLGILYVDIISKLPGVRTGKISSSNLNALMQQLFDYWLKGSKMPTTISSDNGIFHESVHELGSIEANFNLRSMRTAIVHGINDLRGGHDCVYVFLSQSTSPTKSFAKTLALLMPFIDITIRQLEHLPEQLPEVEVILAQDNITHTLSPREIEIMHWVKAGKTNQEVGMILDISAFTVKNHMQRIFKKLDVMNRAQAVTSFNRVKIQ